MRIVPTAMVRCLTVRDADAGLRMLLSVVSWPLSKTWYPLLEDNDCPDQAQFPVESLLRLEVGAVDD